MAHMGRERRDHVTRLRPTSIRAKMAASGGESSQASSDDLFQNFYSEVKQIEKRDSVLTSKQQIDRLLRPGSSYFNLNPFEVLQIDPDATDVDLKKRFRALSILVHPDKNQDDADRAQQAFEVHSTMLHSFPRQTLWKIMK
ncbi:dnaJ homolog subfamily C member 8-like isoform X2 [Festucalex cinctus]